MKYRILFYSTFITVAFAGTGCNPTDERLPILVLATQDNFGLYTGEILKTEGFNLFQVDSLTNARVTLDYLQGFDIVILGETSVTTDQQELLTAYVEEGGNLIAFRPDKKLIDVFGISDADGEVSEAYVSIQDSTGIGRGLITEALQFHGTADKYNLTTGQALAEVSTKTGAAAGFPAVVLNGYGSGKAIAFSYNLPKSIVFTRQGNYQYAGQEMDGILGLRAMDLFTNAWVDISRNTLNQADEQMRLLSHCIENLSTHKRPIPRFWYFPDSLSCLVTLNNDGEDSKEPEFVSQFEDVNAKGAKMTLYIKEVELISKPWVEHWIKKGFEISGHPDNTRQAADPDWNTMDSVYKALQNELKDHYGITTMRTVTNHWFVWVGKNSDGMRNFAAQARIEENNGVGLDCNYAHYDNGSNQGHFLGEFGTRQGNYTGSGLAMKFADISGRIIDVYQQLNNVYDQQYMEHKDKEGYFNAFKGLMDRSLNDEVYSTISVKAHNNEYFFSKLPLLGMLDYSNSNGIPVWTELRFLEFLIAKDEASFSNIKWHDNRLSFTIRSSLTHTNTLTCLIPFTYNGQRINKIFVDAKEQSYTVKSIKGFEYAFVSIKPGFDYNMSVIYILK